MKICLNMFDGQCKMMSRVMDVPESTGTRFEMALTHPIQSFYGETGTVVKENSAINVRCSFEWSGRFLEGTEGTPEKPNRFPVKEYVLTNITK